MAQHATTLDRGLAPTSSPWERARIHVRRHALPYLLILPSVLFLAAIEFYPLGVGLAEAFRYHNRVQPWATRYVGFDNFVDAFRSNEVRVALRTSFLMVVGIVALSYALGLVAGLLLHQRLRGRSIYRALLLVPWITPPIVAYISWQWMLNDQSGLINQVLAQVGLIDEPVLLLADPTLAMGSIIVVGVWARFPFMMITVLAALSAIPDEVTEAAEMDGANRWQIFWHVTFPLILPVTVISTLLQAIWTFNDFALPFILTGGGPANSTTPLVLLSYKEAFQRYNVGYGTSLAVISMVLMLILGVLYFRLQKRHGVEP